MRTATTLPLASVLLGTALTGCTPPRLAAPPEDAMLMRLAAHGVQIYECRSTAGQAPAWSLVAPDADLFDATGRRIGHHGAGPVWQHEDGSGFAGTVRARVDAPQPGSIPWLLLAARPQPTDGAFARVSSVQRVHTAGGMPPARGCDDLTVGAQVRMGYRAEYVLHVPRAVPGAPP